MTAIPASVILPWMAGSIVVAYFAFDLIAHRKLLGGKHPDDIPSLHPKWKEATQLRMFNLEREGAPEKPVLLNPFRNNIPASIRNKDDFPSLSGE